MKRTALALTAAAIIGVTALTAPSPAEARWRGGWGPGIAGGLIGAAIIGGLASSAYAYGPGYGYYGYPYSYGYPVSYSASYVADEPSAYVEEAAPSQSAPASNFWYYCAEPSGYFPYVQNCNKPWMPVIPQSVTGRQHAPALSQ